MNKIYDFIKEQEAYGHCMTSKKEKNDLTLVFYNSISLFDLEDLMHDVQESFPEIIYEIDGNLLEGFVVKIFNNGN